MEFKVDSRMLESPIMTLSCGYRRVRLSLEGYSIGTYRESKVVNVLVEGRNDACMLTNL